MKKTLRILNQLEQKGIIDRYAIGDAMAALFYAEPVLTYDMDMFVFLDPFPSTGEDESKGSDENP